MHTKTLATGFILLSATLVYGVQSEWVKFTSPEGRFSVMLRHEPKFELITDPEDKEVANSRYTDIETGYGFICEYFDVATTGTDLELFLDTTRDGIVKGAGATMVGEKKISLDGYPGRELELTLKIPNGTEMSAQTRIYIVGKRLYSLSYIHAKDLDDTVNSENAAKFFSSFKPTKGN